MSKRESSLYSIEGVVWSALAAGWLTARLALTTSVIDQFAMVTAIVSSVVNMLACSALYQLDQVQSALFGIMFPIWITYAYVIAEAATVSSAVTRVYLEKALFGGMYLPLVAAAISFAFLSVHVLITAAAIYQHLWLSSAWLDNSVILITTLQACLCHRAPSENSIFAIVLAVNLLIILLAVPRTSNIPKDFKVWGVNIFPIMEYANTTLLCMSVALTIGMAYASETTNYALSVVLIPCLAIFIVLRSVFMESPVGSYEELEPSAPPQFMMGEFPAINVLAEAPAMRYQRLHDMQGFPCQSVVPMQSGSKKSI